MQRTLELLTLLGFAVLLMLSFVAMLYAVGVIFGGSAYALAGLAV